MRVADSVSRERPQQIKGFGALEAGIAFLPLTAGIITGSAVSQWLVGRLGVKPVLLGGLALAAAGLAWASALAPGSSYAGGMLPALVMIALGMGNVFVPLTLTATAGVERDDQGLASGVFNTSQQVGGAIGLAVLTTVATNVTAGALADGAERTTALVDGFTTAFGVGAGLLVEGVVVVALFLRGREVDEQVAAGDAVLVAA